jgi:hypothetical protein
MKGTVCVDFGTTEMSRKHISKSASSHKIQGLLKILELD